MIQKNPYAAYNNSKIQTATPAELTLLLYEGAIKFTNIAIVAMEKNDVQKTHDNIMKTEKIIEEFQATLDHKYPVAKDFEAVYSYLLKRLFDANIRKDPEQKNDLSESEPKVLRRMMMRFEELKRETDKKTNF